MPHDLPRMFAVPREHAQDIVRALLELGIADAGQAPATAAAGSMTISMGSATPYQLIEGWAMLAMRYGLEPPDGPATG